MSTLRDRQPPASLPSDAGGSPMPFPLGFWACSHCYRLPNWEHFLMVCCHMTSRAAVTTPGLLLADRAPSSISVQLSPPVIHSRPCLLRSLFGRQRPPAALNPWEHNTPFGRVQFRLASRFAPLVGSPSPAPAPPSAVQPIGSLPPLGCPVFICPHGGAPGMQIAPWNAR